MTKRDVLQLAEFPPWDQGKMEEQFTLHRLWAAPDPGAMLSEVGPSIQAIAVGFHAVCDRDLMLACPNAKLVANYGVGYDTVDVVAATELGVTVTNTPDVLTDDCADLAVGMLLAVARGIVPADSWARSGHWEAAPFPFQTPVSGAKLGVLGLGRIGHGVAKRMAAFDMDIAYGSRSPKDTPADWTHMADPVALAERSDFLVVALAANAETRHTVNSDVLDALGPDGYLINISRAQNIDEDALLDRLENGGIKGAALDVFEGEPVVNPRFKSLDNVLLQPHHASATMKSRAAMGQLVIGNISAYLDGNPPLTPVN